MVHTVGASVGSDVVGTDDGVDVDGAVVDGVIVGDCVGAGSQQTREFQQVVVLSPVATKHLLRDAFQLKPEHP